MTRLFITEQACKHDCNFFCTAVSLPEGGVQHAFACDAICGYWLPFDPVYAGSIQEERVPSQIGVDMWRLNTMAFLPHPSDREGGWKDGPKLSTGGKF